MKLAALAVASLVAPAGPTLALVDDSTGFGVDPQAPYVAKLSEHPKEDVTFGIDAVGGKPAPAGTSAHLCGAGFKRNSANADYKQAQINALVDDRQWRAKARDVLGMMMTIESENVFSIKGARGVEFLATPKIGPDHENVSLMMSLVETPLGRVTFTCAATKADFKAGLDSFRAIRSTITLPR
jgi:hypothetical protein